MTEIFSDDGCLRPMTEDDLACVLSWRNHPNIRRFMFTVHDISLEEHRRWFKRAVQAVTRKLLIYEESDRALGFVHFNETGPGRIADWGFYVAPDAQKGSGRRLGRTAIRFSFEEAGFHKICGQALDFNLASINFHKTLGFQQEGILREQHFDGQHYHDVICFGLLRKDYATAFKE